MGRLSSVRVVYFGLGTVGSPDRERTRELWCSAATADRRRHARNAQHHASRAEEFLHRAEQGRGDGFVHSCRASPSPVWKLSFTQASWTKRWMKPYRDALIEDADLVVAATDSREAQRRVAARALANDVPCIFPALYENGGGEVFVSLGPGAPCLLCWEAFRTENSDLRAVSAINAEVMSVISLAVQLAIGILDPSSSFARLFAPVWQSEPPHVVRAATERCVAIRDRRSTSELPDVPGRACAFASWGRLTTRARTSRPARLIVLSRTIQQSSFSASSRSGSSSRRW